MPNCGDMLELISADIDGELSADDRAALRAHLPTCDSCRETDDALRAIGDGAPFLLADPPPNFSEGVLSAARKERSAARRAARFRRGAVALAAAAAVFALALFGPLRVLISGDITAPEQAKSGETADGGIEPPGSLRAAESGAGVSSAPDSPAPMIAAADTPQNDVAGGGAAEPFSMSGAARESDALSSVLAGPFSAVVSLTYPLPPALEGEEAVHTEAGVSYYLLPSERLPEVEASESRELSNPLLEDIPLDKAAESALIVVYGQ